MIVIRCGCLLRIDDLRLSVFVTVFPGPQMPWNEISSLQIQDMYDQVYSHFVSPTNCTTLQILGPVVIAQGMTPDVDTVGVRPNSSSPKLIAAILGLDHGSVMRTVAELQLLLEVGNEDEDIRIRNPSFVELLLDRTRSQTWFVDIDAAWLLLQNVHAIIGRIFDTEGTWICRLSFLILLTLCVASLSILKSLRVSALTQVLGFEAHGCCPRTM